jgi:hypothetical protein
VSTALKTQNTHRHNESAKGLFFPHKPCFMLSAAVVNALDAGYPWPKSKDDLKLIVDWVRFYVKSS